MGLAVAGLKADEIKDRAKKLASGDWSDFPPAYRVAFRLADKLAREPAKVTGEDVAALTGAFGRERALDVIFYAAWGYYMTRVADAFQFPLEPGNPFMPPAKK